MATQTKEMFGWLGIACLLLIPLFFYFSPKENPVVIEQNRKDNARIFCAMGRQWIEFPNGSATWGAAVLDMDGKPVRCNTILEPNFTKG